MADGRFSTFIEGDANPSVLVRLIYGVRTTVTSRDRHEKALVDGGYYPSWYMPTNKWGPQAPLNVLPLQHAGSGS